MKRWIHKREALNTSLKGGNLPLDSFQNRENAILDILEAIIPMLRLSMEPNFERSNILQTVIVVVQMWGSGKSTLGGVITKVIREGLGPLRDPEARSKRFQQIKDRLRDRYHWKVDSQEAIWNKLESMEYILVSFRELRDEFKKVINTLHWNQSNTNGFREELNKVLLPYLAALCRVRFGQRYPFEGDIETAAPPIGSHAFFHFEEFEYLFTFRDCEGNLPKEREKLDVIYYLYCHIAAPLLMRFQPVYIATRLPEFLFIGMNFYASLGLVSPEKIRVKQLVLGALKKEHVLAFLQSERKLRPLLHREVVTEEEKIAQRIHEVNIIPDQIPISSLFFFFFLNFDSSFPQAFLGSLPAFGMSFGTIPSTRICCTMSGILSPFGDGFVMNADLKRSWIPPAPFEMTKRCLTFIVILSGWPYCR